MAHPTFTDFNSAIQNPSAVFQDSDLRAGTPELTPLGLPKVRAGNIAVTYRIDCNGTSWAVRCFHREIPSDLQMRYDSLTSYFATSKVDGFLPFQYLRSEIWAAGQRNPVVKMAWGSGETLGTYVDHNFNQHQSLGRLSDQFVTLVRNLGTRNIAHGDLQNGNLLVAPSKLTLVDYDGMYVPTMSFSGSNERGHVNFQSPLRESVHFGPYLDRFSSIVIWLSLQAVIHRPELWERFHTSENLILQGGDFVDPAKSQALQEVSTIASLSVHVDQFKRLCQVPIQNLPSLDQFITPPAQAVTLQTVRLSAAQAARTRQYPAMRAEDTGTIRQHVGERVEVIGKVYEATTRSNYGRSYSFVNFDDWTTGVFRVVVWSATLVDLRKKGVEIDHLRGNWISITGLIQTWSDSTRTWLQIIPDEAADLRILGGKTEADEILRTAAQASANADTLEAIRSFRTHSPSQSTPSRVQQPVTAPSPSLGNQEIRDRIQQLSSARDIKPALTNLASPATSSGAPPVPPASHMNPPPPPPSPPPPPAGFGKDSGIPGSVVLLLLLGSLLAGGIWYFTYGQAKPEIVTTPTFRSSPSNVVQKSPTQVVRQMSTLTASDAPAINTQKTHGRSRHLPTSPPAFENANSEKPRTIDAESLDLSA